MDSVLVDGPREHVRRVRINRPGKRNAVDAEVRSALYGAFATLREDFECRSVVFGGVEGVLSAGGDLPSMRGMSEATARQRMREGHELCELVNSFPRPAVVAAEGVIAGAALGLALLCDFVVASPSSRFMLPFFKLGLVPDWGLLYTLPRRIGLPATRKLVFGAETVSGDEAFRLGLVDYLTDDGRVMEHAIETAESLAELPLQAVQYTKARLQNDLSFAEDLVREEEEQTLCFIGPEFREGLGSVTEKRKSNFVAVTASQVAKHDG